MNNHSSINRRLNVAQHVFCDSFPALQCFLSLSSLQKEGKEGPAREKGMGLVVPNSWFISSLFIRNEPSQMLHGAGIVTNICPEHYPVL